MPFIGDDDWRLMDYRARWRVGDRTVVADVRWDTGGDAMFLALVDGEPHAVDDEGDLLDLAPPGTAIIFERGGVTVSIRRGGGAIEARASALVEGRERAGPSVTASSAGAAIERALYALGELDADRAGPRVCFLCAHSDYEPSTGFGGGHLACFVEDAERYHAFATSEHSSERKWGVWRESLRYRWVDELDTCARWRRRPPRHGYRG
jgi:hypothetical protein